MRIIIDEIKNESVCDITRTVSFDVCYTVKNMFSSKQYIISCRAEILTQLKDVIHFYDVSNWCSLSGTLGFKKCKGVSMHIRSFVRMHFFQKEKVGCL